MKSRRRAGPSLTAPTVLFAFLFGLAAVLACVRNQSGPKPPPATATVPAAVGLAEFDVLDVDQGDSILIRSPEGKTALIDAGPSGDVVTLLERLGVRTLDMAVVTHHHIDHYGGMSAVVRRFRPRLFLTSDSSHTATPYLRLLTTVRDSGAQVIFPAGNPRTVRLGSVTLTLFPQPPEDRDEENNNSIGIRADHGGFSFLLTGDSEVPERAFWETHVPNLIRGCTVLKLAHHGSRNGVDAAWLDLAHPQLAVVSVGRGNDYGHPHRQAVSLLSARRIPLLRTDRDGTITIRSDGRRWGVVRPSRVAGVPTFSTDPKAETPTPLLDLNTATDQELMDLPGIGPALAEKIRQGRPYRSVDDLMRVPGIGPKRMEEIRPLVTVR